MNDIVRVRLAERVGNLRGNIQRVVERKPLSRHARFERFTFDVLHSDIASVALFINFINGADVRMVERRCRLSFAQ